MVFIKMFQIKPALPIDVLIEKLDNLRKDIYEAKANSRDAENKPVFQDDGESSQTTSGEVAGTAESIEPFPAPPLDLHENIDSTWAKLLSIFLEKYPSLAANLKNSSIKSLDHKRLEIEVNGNDFNINMVKRQKNRDIIKKVCSDFFGKDIKVIIASKRIQKQDNQDKKGKADRLKQEALSHPLVTDALEIFNGTIVDVKIL
jgi:DNA polymerase-3 subunit gamma/tau